MYVGPTCQRTSSAVWCCGPLRKLNVNKLSYTGYARSLRLPLHVAHQPPAYKISIQRFSAMKIQCQIWTISTNIHWRREIVRVFGQRITRMQTPSIPSHWLSRAVRSLFGPIRKSSPWGNFSDGGLNQSIKRRLSLQTFGLIDWLAISQLWLDWFIGFVPHDLFLRGGGAKVTEHRGTIQYQKSFLPMRPCSKIFKKLFGDRFWM